MGRKPIDREITSDDVLRIALARAVMRGRLDMRKFTERGLGLPRRLVPEAVRRADQMIAGDWQDGEEAEDRELERAMLRFRLDSLFGLLWEMGDHTGAFRVLMESAKVLGLFGG